jgi:uncharacterized glyoxalase superfamily protein PhnB
MTAVFKPAGYPSLSPYLMVQGAQRTIDFLTQAFGATELRRFDCPDGTIMRVDLRRFFHCEATTSPKQSQ